MTHRAVFDTNIWVSAFLTPTGPPAKLVNHWKDGSVVAVVSLPLLEELAEVLSRPRLLQKYRYTPADVALYLTLIVSRAHLVQVSHKLTICRDPKDNVVLEAAIAGEVQAVVTRDDDLKRDPTVHSYAEAHGFRVLSVSQYLSIFPPPTSQPE